MFDNPKLYHELAEWFHLLTAPAEYVEEAEFYTRKLIEACDRPPRTILELGSGGGNNASHMKAKFEMTLTDLSQGMLELSRSLNPECEHVQGDMRTLRLGRKFDAVFVHDAVVYMTAKKDLRAAIETAFVHCRRGGAALFAPDRITMSFDPNPRPTTSARNSSRTPTTAATTARTGAASVTSSGPGTRTHRMIPTRSISPTSCARRTDPCALRRTGISRGCSRAIRGCGC